MDAMQTRDNVLQELRFEPRVDASRIDVAVSDNGVVMLSGSVTTQAERRAAERAARRVAGVSALASEIEVALPGDVPTSDAQLTLAIVERFRWSSTIPDKRVRVSVDRGWVTLEGEVSHHYQCEAAETEVSALLGVVGVTNRIRIRPPLIPLASQIEAEIGRALLRRSRLDARRIAVRVTESRVVLEGQVGSGAEAEAAEEIAWDAPGVARVENRLVISR